MWYIGGNNSLPVLLSHQLHNSIKVPEKHLDLWLSLFSYAEDFSLKFSHVGTQNLGWPKSISGPQSLHLVPEETLLPLEVRAVFLSWHDSFSLCIWWGLPQRGIAAWIFPGSLWTHISSLPQSREPTIDQNKHHTGISSLVSHWVYWGSYGRADEGLLTGAWVTWGQGLTDNPLLHGWDSWKLWTWCALCSFRKARVGAQEASLYNSHDAGQSPPPQQPRSTSGTLLRGILKSGSFSFWDLWFVYFLSPMSLWTPSWGAVSIQRKLLYSQNVHSKPVKHCKVLSKPIILNNTFLFLNYYYY